MRIFYKGYWICHQCGYLTPKVRDARGRCLNEPLEGFPLELSYELLTLRQMLDSEKPPYFKRYHKKYNFD